MRTRNLCAGLLMAAVALSCLAGCKKDEGETVVLGTQFEKTVSVQKTYLGEGNTVCWSTGDKVKINDAEYTCGSSISVTASDHYYAVYPCSSSNTVSESGGQVEIPVVQTYTVDGNGVQQLNGPMAARLDSRDKNGILYFKNLYSLLRVKVSAYDKDFTVNSITVTATGSEAKALTGSYSYTFRGATTEDTASAPTVSDITSGGSTSVTLVCSSNNVVTANTDRDFYLAVHPINGHSLKVDVHGVREGKSVVYTYSSETRHKLNRSRIGSIGINLQQLQPVMGIGFFSVAPDRYVTFSSGNLQYQASTNTWRFAEHQWDYVGDATKGTVYAGSVKCDNASISSTYTGWIDLFGWGTSGWNNGNKCYQPYDNTSGEYASSKGFGYGPTDGKDNYLISLTGDYANADWGVYNAIYNPKTGSTDDAGTWRTLTKDEWVYLLGTEAGTRGASGWWIYNMVTIEDAAGEGKDVLGLIIYPDGVTAADLSGFTGKANFSQNSQTAAEITKAEFETLEAMGCVFLPAAGYRNGTPVYDAGSNGNYCSSTYYNSNAAYNLSFDSGKNVGPSKFNYRYRGRSVRLVKNVK